MIPLLYEHEDFLIIDKPQGLNVHNDEENDQKGLLTLLREQRKEADLMLVHRLDKLTSGLMIIARSSKATQVINEMFKEHKISKTYLALSSKKPSKKQGTIKGDLVKGRGGAYYLQRSSLFPSITQFSTKPINERRVFILRPQTGKTHQLRVVMKSLGSPILGDELYGGEKSDRMYLHAFKLEFTYMNKEYSFLRLPTDGEHFLALKLREDLF